MVIELVLIPRLTKGREIVFLLTWGSRVCFGEYFSPILDFVGGEDAATSTATSSVLLDHVAIGFRLDARVR